MPGIAEAKTFNAHFEDPAGDSTTDARDIVAGRVAYNRRTGVLSAQVTVADDYANESDDAIVMVVVSDLVKGRCRKVSMTMGGVLSDPAVPVAWKGNTNDPKHKYYGAGTVDGATYSMRVKAKGLSGRTPGCVYMGIITNEQSAKLLDETTIDNGFA